MATLALKHLNLGDIPTWLAVIAATGAAIVALIQLRGQQKDIARQAAALERQQANKIDLRQSKQSKLRPPGADQSTRLRYWHMTEVSNESQRPIRNVVAKLVPPGNSKEAATQVVRFEPGSGTNLKAERTWTPVAMAEADAVPLIRVGEHWAFIFPRPVAEDVEQNVKTVARFTDDAGLHWQINDELHLEKLKRRDW